MLYFHNLLLSKNSKYQNVELAPSLLADSTKKKRRLRPSNQYPVTKRLMNNVTEHEHCRTLVIIVMIAVFLDRRKKTTVAVEHDRPSTDSQTDESTETLVSDHDGPGNGDNMVSTKKSEVNGDIERERLINDYDRDVTISVSIDSRVHLTDVGLYGDSERTNKKLSNSLIQRTDEQDQVMTEIELDRIGNDSDQDTLLGGDGDKTHTGASRVRSRPDEDGKKPSLWLYQITKGPQVVHEVYLL